MLISSLIYYLVRALNSTYRYRFLAVENLQEACINSKDKNYIFATWHQNCFHGVLAQNTRTHVVIISKSKDGNIVDFICQKMGHFVVRGSSKNSSGVDKGGKAAKEQMIETIKSGIAGAVTVDGPQGPAKIAKPGIVDMAKKTGAPIVPYIPIAKSFWTFKSWDKFRLPKPFSKIIICYGKAIFVPENTVDLDFEKFQEELRLSLNQNEIWANENFKNWSKLTKNNYTIPRV